MFCSVLVRRLKEATSFEQLTEAWKAEPRHFSMPVRVVHSRRTGGERRSCSERGPIPLHNAVDIGAEELDTSLQQIAEGEKRRHDRITEVIKAAVMSGI